MAIILSSLCQAIAQDTIIIPLKIKVGLDILGPAVYLIEKNSLSLEGYVAADLNEKFTAVFGAGYLNYEYSQYNYNYLNKGAFIRTGIDLNILKPNKSLGKYWGGLSLRYGLSRFTSEVPLFKQDNYWGPASSSIPPKKSWGHFIEASPGVRAEIFRNISIGWTINVRMLLYAGSKKDLRPIYFPGYGNAEKRITSGFTYFIAWNMPYKKIKVIIKKEEPEEPEEPEEIDETNMPEESIDYQNPRLNTNPQQSPRRLR